MILDGQTPDAIAHAAQQLHLGALIGLPTETVYGLAADALNDLAVGQIFQRKGRPADHPLIVHVLSSAQAGHFAAELPDSARQLMQAFWPGPVTLIVPRKPDVANACAGSHDSIGMRCPSHPVAQRLLQACLQLPEPVYGLAAPSANRFGRISPTTAAHVADEFGDDLLVLDGGACDVGIESTIIDCTRGTPVILRPGMIGAAEIKAATGLQVSDPFNTEAEQQPVVEGQAPAAPGTLTAHYAPNAKVRLMDAASIQAGLNVLGEQARHIAIYARSPMRSPSTNVVLQTMPTDPALVAHELFGVLRTLDEKGVKLIWVEVLPEDPAWNGVRDRLERAAATP